MNETKTISIITSEIAKSDRKNCFTNERFGKISEFTCWGLDKERDVAYLNENDTKICYFDININIKNINKINYSIVIEIKNGNIPKNKSIIWINKENIYKKDEYFSTQEKLFKSLLGILLHKFPKKIFALQHQPGIDLEENNNILSSKGKNLYALADNGNDEIVKKIKEFKKCIDEKNNKAFSNLFEYLLNRFHIKKKIHKILQLWLPLAIDIQGLSEVYQKSAEEKEKSVWKDKSIKYWIDIKTSIEDSMGKFEKLLQEHNNIAGDFEKLKWEKSEESHKLKKFIENLDSRLDSRKDDYFPDEEYLKADSKHFFFPDWLEKYAKKLNEIQKNQ